MQVSVRDNNVDQALRALKKKLQREGVFREMKLDSISKSRRKRKPVKRPKRSVVPVNWHGRKHSAKECSKHPFEHKGRPRSSAMIPRGPARGFVVFGPLFSFT